MRGGAIVGVMIVAEMTTVPQWLVYVVGVIVSVAALVCVGLLGVLLKFYWDDRKQAAEDRRQAAEDRKQAADDRRQNEDARRQAADDRRQNEDARRQAADDRKQNEDAHRALGKQIDSAKDEVKAEVAGVKDEVAGLSAKVDKQGKVLRRVRKDVATLKEQYSELEERVDGAGQSGS